mmetsp:Transcript_87851/g.107641  ORF Transcript_87851/g.107641 Transcript_87851/m.107641 type:complete len:95 (+) Transcript_87851:89-373(+)
MVFKIIISIIALINIINAGLIDTVQDCFAAWSRCTPATQSLSGYAWLTCSQRCQCMGYSDGKCKIAASNCLKMDTYQCQCKNYVGGLRPSWCGF